MNDFLFCMADRQKETLHLIAGQLGVSMSEVLRRLMDYGFQRRVINEVFPVMSGQIKVR